MLTEKTKTSLGFVAGISLAIISAAAAITTTLVSLEHRLTKIETTLATLVERSNHVER